MEKQKFEKDWRDAFQASEQDPSETVWTNIELDLERQTSGSMRRRLVFFQLLAAASMVFAMGIGSFYYLSGPSSVTESQLAANDQQQDGSEEQSGSEKKTASEGASSIRQDDTVQDLLNEKEATTRSAKALNERSSTTYRAEGEITSSDKDVTANALAENTKANGSNISVSAHREDANTTNNTVQTADNSTTVVADRELHFRDRALPTLTSFYNPRLNITPELVEDPGLALLARLKEEEKKYQEDDKKDEYKDRLWTSLGVSAGTYSPNASSYSTGIGTSNYLAPSTTASAGSNAGSAYSVGITVGGRIAKRLVIQGGIAYLNQNAEFMSTAVSGSNVAMNEFSLTADHVTATNPYAVNTSLQYVSLPVQAGYYVLDGSFAIQVNGGVSTDFFLRSTLSAEDSQFEDISTGPGSNSPYRSLNFSGLVGTELSYRFSDHYQLAVNPGFRYALSSIYKSEVSANLSPVTFDIGVRFKYIFPM